MLVGVSLARGVAGGDAESPESNGLGSAGVDFVATDGGSAVSRDRVFGGAIGRLLSFGELV